MKPMKNISFKWSNYTKPTPYNLQVLAGVMREFVTLIAGFGMIMELNKWLPIGVLTLGWILDKLKNFFAHVAHEGDIETVSVSYPAEMSDSIEVKQEDKTNGEGTHNLGTGTLK
jgi:hypothetical protein